MSACGRVVGILGATLALYVALSVGTARYNAATFDEGAHLPAGYTYAALSDYRLNPEHPPAVKLLAALPLLLGTIHLPQDDAAWQARRQWEFGRRFLYRWNDGDRLLFYGRLPIIGLGAALVLALFVWARRLSDPATALAAALVAALSPDMLAHGSLVTTDMGIALFGFLCVAALERLGEGITPARVAGLAVAFALAVSTKFSALLLLPVLGVLGLVLVFAGEPLVVRVTDEERSLSSRVARLAALVSIGLVAFVVAYGVLWAMYGFHFAASPDTRPPLQWARVEPAAPLLRTGASAALEHHLLPEAFVLGFLRFFHASEGRPSFLLGQVSKDGFWYYFPATFLLKTPLPLLLLLALAALSDWRRRPLRREAFLWVPPLLYLGLVMTRSLNIGHRHLLPIYPYLFILAARVAVRGWREGRTPVRVALVILSAWYAVGTLSLHPRYLAYFNELAGGPRNGYRCLVDSSLDWGQDLKALKAWMDGQGIREIKLAYFGSAEPSYYGIGGERLPGDLRPAHVAERIHAGDVVAVSATHLAGLYLDDAEASLMRRFRAQAPIARVGYSILIYRADRDYDVPRTGFSEEP